MSTATMNNAMSDDIDGVSLYLVQDIRNGRFMRTAIAGRLCGIGVEQPLMFARHQYNVVLVDQRKLDAG